jgi:hypothetical protein
MIGLAFFELLRANDRHYTNAEKQAARQKMNDKASSRR